MPDTYALNHILNLRPETELLLACARRAVAGRRVTDHQPAAELNWGLVLHLAEQHGLLPLLHQSLQADDGSTLPAAVDDQLRRQFQANARRNLFMTAELLRLLDALQAQGIAAIPYKGPILAAAVYGDVALRQFIDLDILVQQHQVLAAKAVLTKLGYRPNLQLSAAEEAALLKTNHQYSFRHEVHQTYVELQWGFTRRYFAVDFDMAQIWTQPASTIGLGGRELPVLPPELLLLILCVHGAKHLWARLGWMCDVALLLRTYPDLEWAAVTNRARRLGSERMLRLGLFLAHHYLGAPLPAEMRRQLAAEPDLAPLAAGTLRRSLAGADSLSPLPPDSVHFHRLQLRLRERWRDRLRYCLRLAAMPTEAEQMEWPLPPALAPLRTLLRPLRLLARYGLPAHNGAKGHPHDQTG